MISIWSQELQIKSYDYRPVKVVINVSCFVGISVYLCINLSISLYGYKSILMGHKKTDKKFGLVRIVVIHQNFEEISRIRLDIKLRFSEIKIFDQLIWQFDRKDLLLQIKLFENVVFVEIFVGPISIKPIACVTSSLILGVGFESRLPFPVCSHETVHIRILWKPWIFPKFPSVRLH